MPIWHVVLHTLIVLMIVASLVAAQVATGFIRGKIVIATHLEFFKPRT